MLAVVKTHHIDFTIQGNIPEKLLQYLQRTYGPALRVDNECPVRITKTDWFRRMSRQVQPGDAIRVYRENRKWTQEELGKKIGVSKYRVSDLENHRRAVSKEIAKKLSRLFQVPLDRFI